MSVTPEDWDARMDRLIRLLPARIGNAVAWLRKPSRRPIRIVAALGLIAGGFLSILPVFGLWMLPLGLALLSDDIPAMKPLLERAARYLERVWNRIRWRKSDSPPAS